jgi:hypothetical protein
MNFFLTMTDSVTSQNIDLSFWITQCEEFFDEDTVQETVNEINCCAQQLKNIWGNIFFRSVKGK